MLPGAVGEGRIRGPIRCRTERTWAVEKQRAPRCAGYYQTEEEAGSKMNPLLGMSHLK